eukprot:m.7553 g.7553  ORF g.7553 m.7553 type:complete len:465 (+) comp5262_c0_seq1:164-1558(+)
MRSLLPILLVVGIVLAIADLSMAGRRRKNSGMTRRHCKQTPSKVAKMVGVQRKQVQCSSLYGRGFTKKQKCIVGDKEFTVFCLNSDLLIFQVGTCSGFSDYVLVSTPSDRITFDYSGAVDAESGTVRCAAYETSAYSPSQIDAYVAADKFWSAPLTTSGSFGDSMFVTEGDFSLTQAPQLLEVQSDTLGNYKTFCSIRPLGTSLKCPAEATNPNQVDPCFPAGSLVLMSDGTSKKIENVALGDEVACYDSAQGSRGTCTVTTFNNKQKTLAADFIVLTYADADGAMKNLSATKMHLIFRATDSVVDSPNMPAGTFINAKNFQVGDLLVRTSPSGNVYTVEIVSVEVTRFEEYYSPITNNYNTIVVEDVVASSFTGRSTHENYHYFNAPMWQKIDERFPIGTQGKDFPNGLHPLAAYRLEAFGYFGPRGKFLNANAFANFLKPQVDAGVIVSQEFVEDSMLNFFS